MAKVNIKTSGKTEVAEATFVIGVKSPKEKHLDRIAELESLHKQLVSEGIARLSDLEVKIAKAHDELTTFN